MSFFAELDFTVVWEYLPALLNGLLTNVTLTVLGFLAGGVVLGTLLALANLSPLAVLRWPAMMFVELLRSTPLLVQAVWVHFAFPMVTQVQTTPFQSAAIALVFNVAAYCSEVIRSGILGVPRGQYEAAKALGMPRRVMWWKVIMPQALRLVVPPLVGSVISIFKATAILSVLAINDLMRVASRVSSYAFATIEIYTVAALLFFLTGAAITYAGSRLEHGLKRGGR